MPNDDQTSSRIEILRFPLIIGVVFIHNFDTTVSMVGGAIGVAHNSVWVEFVRLFVSRGVARVAVPLLFLVSGYLFFFGEWSWERYGSKLKRRLHTLLIPFLFWNLATLVVFAVVQSIPQTKIYFVGTVWPPVYSFSFFDYFNALLGIAVKYPIAFQFWFIRDLMALVVLAPAIHILLARKSLLPFITGLFFLWFFSVWPVLWPSVEASFFFSLGACLFRPGMSVTYLDKFGPWISAMFLGSLIFNSAFPDRLPYLGKFVIVFGAPSLWWLTGLAARTVRLKALLMRLSGASFFVFAAHEPLLIVVRKITYKLFAPASGVAIISLYFLIPICLIAFLVAAHRYLLQTVPSFVSFITGSLARSNQLRA
jgi:surface polysaccharide O-acyltransferase-like enzyme